MNEARPLSAERLPTLTEVVELDLPTDGLSGPDLLPLPVLPFGFDFSPATAVEAVASAPEPARVGPDPETLVAQVLCELAPRIDALFEARLREALAPALARVADGLIRDAGGEVSATLRALVEETVAQVLRRRDVG